MRKIVTSLAALLALAVSGCAPQVDVGADKAAIRALGEQAIATFNTNDAAALSAFVTDDAVWMPPNQPAVIGREAFQGFYGALFDQFTCEITIPPVEEVVVFGDWAFVRGIYEFTATPKAGGEAQQETGKYIWILQRQADGSWKYARDIWNSDQPAASE